jgi:uncharacterized protein (DUF1810 family)
MTDKADSMSGSDPLQLSRQYLEHPVLGKRLRECAETILALEGLSAPPRMGIYRIRVDHAYLGIPPFAA